MPVPITFEPSSNVTEPIETPFVNVLVGTLVGAVTVAVNVTLEPKAPDVIDSERVVVVGKKIVMTTRSSMRSSEQANRRRSRRRRLSSALFFCLETKQMFDLSAGTGIGRLLENFDSYIRGKWTTASLNT